MLIRLKNLKREICKRMIAIYYECDTFAQDMDYLESKRTLTTATMLALVGCFALGQNPGYFSAFLLFLGVISQEKTVSL